MFAMLARLPTEIAAQILSLLDVVDLTRLWRVSKAARALVREHARSLRCLPEPVPVHALGFVVEHCTRVAGPPDVSKARNAQCARPGALDDEFPLTAAMLARLLDRWPTQLVLDWNVAASREVDAFLRCACPSLHLVRLRHLTLRITEEQGFCESLVAHAMPALRLCSMRVDAEGVSLERVLQLLGARTWSTRSLYMRGDIEYVSDVLTYLPDVTSELTLVNTEDLTSCTYKQIYKCIEFLLVCGVERAMLINVIRMRYTARSFFCHAAAAIEDAIEDNAAVHDRHRRARGSDPHWTFDHLDVKTARLLVTRRIRVACGVFGHERDDMLRLRAAYPRFLHITDVAHADASPQWQ